MATHSHSLPLGSFSMEGFQRLSFIAANALRRRFARHGTWVYTRSCLQLRVLVDGEDVGRILLRVLLAVPALHVHRTSDGKDGASASRRGNGNRRVQGVRSLLTRLELDSLHAEGSLLLSVLAGTAAALSERLLLGLVRVVACRSSSGGAAAVAAEDSVEVVVAADDSVEVVVAADDSVEVVVAAEDSVEVVVAAEDSVEVVVAAEDSVEVVVAAEDSVEVVEVADPSVEVVAVPSLPAVENSWLHEAESVAPPTALLSPVPLPATENSWLHESSAVSLLPATENSWLQDSEPAMSYSFEQSEPAMSYPSEQSSLPAMS
ncbi:unnamed protein product [Phytophthora fragariaefolia]|uniref:Unnamed protein product n=1 Tax=Phytophthora fragariaefolia TaxID=1490495 RepID=A0A9W6YBD7_9STRA|nr:unnamed protein product [Phytophthora fragariaefolia]